jgi:hypothetical protein
MREHFDNQSETSQGNEACSYSLSKMKEYRRKPGKWLPMGGFGIEKFLRQVKAEAAGCNPAKGDTPRIGEKSFFSVTFNRIKAAQLITDLGDDEFDVRETAQNLLERMGPLVLPQLQQALKSHKEQARNRVQSAIFTIETHARKEREEFYLKAAARLVPVYQKLLEKAGCSMNPCAETIHEKGERKKIGPQAVPDRTLAAPTEIEQEVFDDLLREVDGVPNGELRKAIDEARQQALDVAATDGEKNHYFNLIWLDRAQEEARLWYARALSESNIEDDMRKGAYLFMQHMRQSLREPQPREMEVALRLGLDENREFLELFLKKGGSLETLMKAEGESGIGRRWRLVWMFSELSPDKQTGS